ncbi:MAG: PQQ-dependent sugar dehydrogenase [Chloroflexi bacterium]|nr:PQQ-dependent sugar dehydrogenase [Chloroflexota bacterium]
MKHTFLFLLFTLFLVACGGEDVNPVTPPIAPSFTPAAATPDSAAAINTLPPPELTDSQATVPPDLALSPTPAEPTLTATPEPTPVPTIPSQQAFSINLDLIVEGLISPVTMAHAGDDRLFILEQRGTIRILQNGQLLGDDFLDIQGRVGDSANEQGLLGIAFHPDYANNGRFFLDYTNDAGDTVISEFMVTADANRADADSERILLTIDQPYENHNGGQLQFGPDGFLYIGMGDGGSQADPEGNGQNTDALLGKILRLDVDNGLPYAIPADNPYVNGGGRLEIWAIGLRNPWRFSFDRLTNDLFIADVGQDSFEEVSFYPAGSPGGANFGWNIMEGWTCFNSSNCNTDGLIQPITVYGRDEGCSITGGYMYRGTEYPALYGNYFFADFCFGTVWGLFPMEGNWLKTTVTPQTLLQITSFGEDVNGELYVLSRLGGVYRVTE